MFHDKFSGSEEFRPPFFRVKHSSSLFSRRYVNYEREISNDFRFQEVFMSRDIIMQAIPHRDPFLFVDAIVEVDEKKIVCEKTFTGKEAFFQGHYPEYPLVPGVLLCESALQTGAVFLSQKMASDEKTFAGKMPVVAKMSDIRFRQEVRPGDTIRMTVELEDSYANAFQMSGTVTVGGKMSVKLKFTVMMVEKQD